MIVGIREAVLTTGILLFAGLLFPQAGNCQNGNKSAAAVEVEVLELNEFGFIPTHITRGPGVFYLRLLNVTRQTPQLTLARENGPQLKEFSLSRQKRRSNDRYDLTSGEYILSDANHPAWKCRISVKNAK